MINSASIIDIFMIDLFEKKREYLFKGKNELGLYVLKFKIIFGGGGGETTFCDVKRVITCHVDKRRNRG